MQELTLPNGLRVYLMEDHEVPAVRGTLLMRGGQRGSPPDRLGVATISAGVQRAGGSVTHPGPGEMAGGRGGGGEGVATTRLTGVLGVGRRGMGGCSRSYWYIMAAMRYRLHR